MKTLMKHMAVTLAVLLATVAAQAITKTWDGGGADDAWSTALNWTDDVAPADFDDLVLTGDVRTNNLSTGTVANRNYSVTFDANAGTFYIGTAGQTIRLKPEGIVNNSVYTQIFTEVMQLNPASLQDCVINCAAGPISFAGPVSAQLNFLNFQNGIVKEGSHYLDLGAGSCSYQGNLTINQGMVLCRGNAVVGASDYGMVIVNDGTTIDLNPTTAGRSYNRKPMVLYGQAIGSTASAITWNSNIYIMSAAAIISNPGTFTVNGTITGVYGLTKTGAGNLTLNPTFPALANGTNAYTGPTRILQGSLQIKVDGALGIAPAAFDAKNLELHGARLTIPNESLNVNRGIWLGENGGAFAPSSVNSIWTNDCSISGPGALTIANNMVALGGDNSFTGGLYMIGGNGPIVTSDSNLGAVPASPEINLTVSNDWGLALTAYETFTLHANRKINLTRNNQIWVKTGKTLTIDGEITGHALYISPGGGATAGTNTRDKVELRGTLVLAPGNSYTNKTVVNLGTLRISDDSCLGAIPAPIADAITLGGDSPDELPYNAILEVTDDVMFDANRGLRLLNAANAIDVASNKTVTVQGDASDVGGLNKLGQGTLRLVGANTYTGPTVVRAGILGGTGSAGSATVKSGAALAPGASIGTMTYTDVSFEEGSRYLCETAPASADVLHVLGTLTLPAAANSVTVSLSGVAAPNPMSLFTLDNPLGGGDIASIYVDKGSVPGVPVVQQIGNDIVITGMIPEPGVMGAALAALALRIRRRAR